MLTSLPPHFLAAVHCTQPHIALVLGSGMSDLLCNLSIILRLSFEELPEVTAGTTVAGHRGSIVVGTLSGIPVLVFQGRIHYYEGHSWEQITYPIRLIHALGVRKLLLTNAAGGIADALVPGSLMNLRDHIEWTRPYAWRHPGPGSLGGSRPSPYSARVQEILAETARDLGLDLYRGIYGAVTGPCYETPAEIRALRIWGADAVGMSTAREAQTAADLGIACGALSLITNHAAGIITGPIHHGEVLATASQQGQKLADLVERAVPRIVRDC